MTRECYKIAYNNTISFPCGKKCEKNKNSSISSIPICKYLCCEHIIPKIYEVTDRLFSKTAVTATHECSNERYVKPIK